MTTYQNITSNSDHFSQAWRSLAKNQFWSGILLAVGVATNAIYAHAPLAAFASLSGATLSRRRAVGVALSIWFVNQAIGFGVRGYPLTPVAFTWGALMGIGTVLAVMVASMRLGMNPNSWLGYGRGIVIATVLGFAVYQSVILFAFPVLADGHLMGWGIVGKLFLKHLMWAGGITIFHSLLLWRTVNRRQSVI
ncbi:MAG: hypothetical protein SWJ54_24090 [Cyanobacteriota bacterium]|nr:hypothetical protein [Cyanobacteriota bacterium]